MSRLAPPPPASERLAGWPGLGLALALLAGSMTSPALGQEPLTLRSNDAEVRPGGLAVVVLRTYAPRGVGQGQLCMRAVEPPAQLTIPGDDSGAEKAGEGLGHPFVALEEVVVFSAEGDATSSSNFDPLSQTAILSFESLSATINSTDGPLAALFFRVDPDIAPGALFELRIDPGDTFLIDEDGQEVPLEIRSGELEILAPGDPVALAAEGDRIPPGTVAHAGVSSAEGLALASGVVSFLYDTTLVAGSPMVTLDPRHGESVASVDLGTPGRVTVSFDSPDGSLNTIPGQLISIALPLRPDIPIGTLSPVSLDPSSWAEDASGQPLELALGDDVIEIVAPEVLFADGFESGDLSGWSQTGP